MFLLVLREGVETVLILSAVSLNSTELMSFTGTLLGVAVAVVFGVMFIRGSVKINLQRFFPGNQRHPLLRYVSADCERAA